MKKNLQAKSPLQKNSQEKYSSIKLLGVYATQAVTSSHVFSFYEFYASIKSGILVTYSTSDFGETLAKWRDGLAIFVNLLYLKSFYM